MKHRSAWLVVTHVVAALSLGACSPAPSTAGKTEATKVEQASGKIVPAKIEKVEGTALNRVTLSEKAAQRLDIQTAPVREERLNGLLRKVIPYAAVIYDVQGKTWAYTSPARLTFVRAPISVDYIEGDKAILTDGPPPGTPVATVGVAELFGADTGIGK